MPAKRHPDGTGRDTYIIGRTVSEVPFFQPPINAMDSYLATRPTKCFDGDETKRLLRRKVPDRLRPEALPIVLSLDSPPRDRRLAPLPRNDAASDCALPPMEPLGRISRLKPPPSDLTSSLGSLGSSWSSAASPCSLSPLLLDPAPCLVHDLHRKCTVGYAGHVPRRQDAVGKSTSAFVQASEGRAERCNTTLPLPSIVSAEGAPRIPHRAAEPIHSH
eukprot:EG_transcript_9363